MALICPLMIAFKKGYNIITSHKDGNFKCFEATGCLSTRCKIRIQDSLKKGIMLDEGDVNRRLGLVIAIDDIFKVLVENNLLDKVEKKHLNFLINEAKSCLDAVNNFNQEKGINLSTIIDFVIKNFNGKDLKAA
ncbi:MAG: hypothetical protein HQK91_10430 [Nitrospirae bacterium]|nr:hypothetical protein [Nitrospirota bacterium]